MLADEGCQPVIGTFLAAALAQVQPRLAAFRGEVRRAFASAGQRSGNREDDSAVGVADVPFGALQVRR